MHFTTLKNIDLLLQEDQDKSNSETKSVESGLYEIKWTPEMQRRILRMWRFL